MNIIVTVSGSLARTIATNFSIYCQERQAVEYLQKNLPIAIAPILNAFGIENLEATLEAKNHNKNIFAAINGIEVLNHYVANDVDTIELNCQAFNDAIVYAIACHADKPIPLAVKTFLDTDPIRLHCRTEKTFRIPAGEYNGAIGLVSDEYWAGSQAIEISDQWTQSYVSGHGVGKSLTIYWTPEDWSATLQSKSDLRKQAIAENQAQNERLLGEAQKFVGWTITEIGADGVITIQSPEGGEFSFIESRHAVWNYGDNSASWLLVGGISINYPYTGEEYDSDEDDDY